MSWDICFNIKEIQIKAPGSQNWIQVVFLYFYTCLVLEYKGCRIIKLSKSFSFLLENLNSYQKNCSYLISFGMSLSDIGRSSIFSLCMEHAHTNTGYYSTIGLAQIKLGRCNENAIYLPLSTLLIFPWNRLWACVTPCVRSLNMIINTFMFVQSFYSWLYEHKYSYLQKM